MNYTSISDVLYADACLVFMVTGVICAAIRWFHMCRPYNENEDYFYPARKQVTFFLVAIAMQFPYFLNPSDSETWCYIRTFGVIFYPVCYAMLFPAISIGKSWRVGTIGSSSAARCCCLPQA